MNAELGRQRFTRAADTDRRVSEKPKPLFVC